MPASIDANDVSPLNATIDPNSSVITFEQFDAPVTVKFSPPKEDSWQKFLDFLGGTISDAKEAGEKVGESLQNNLKSINVDMSSVSVFTVSNLLFPGKKVIDLQSIHLAQDLVLFGDVNKDYKP